jgi:hypothetical protein
MRSLLLASVALMAGPAVPPKAPLPPALPEQKPPCATPEDEPRPLRPANPSDAQRYNPGLF